MIEDDKLAQSALRQLLNDTKHVIFSTIDEFLSSPEAQKNWNLMLLDLCHPGDTTGKGTLSRMNLLRTQFPEMDIIIQSGIGDVEIMRESVRNGALKFILKDHLTDEIPALLEWQKEYLQQKIGLDEIILGQSEVMRKLKRDLLKFRFENQVNVLIEGETGTGKELCAQAVHSSGPFIGVNVSAIPSELFESEFFGSDKGAFTGASQNRMGHFEAVGQGTLFLDEIQALSPQHQAKLLRVLETKTFVRLGSNTERPMKARIVSASNQRLRESVAKGLFREDLYFRLASLTIQVPPLRIRGNDIALLAQFFLKQFEMGGKKSFTQKGLDLIVSGYDWPGNVRELRGFVRQIILKTQIPLLDAPEIQQALGILGGKESEERYFTDLKETAAASGQAFTSLNSGSPQVPQFVPNWGHSFDKNVEDFEKYLLVETLKKYKSVEAREKLGLARSRFYEKLKHYGISN